MKKIIAGWSIFFSALASQNAFAVDQTLDIQSADAYWQKKAEHNTTTAVDDYMSKHPQNTDDASSAGYEIGAGARNRYTPKSLGAGLNEHQSGGGGIVDLAGQKVKNTTTTNYDLCLLNNPKNPTVCDVEKTASENYKKCKYDNPSTYATACSSFATLAIAPVDFKQQCQNSRPYIKVNYVPDSVSFDIKTLVIGIDPKLDGNTQIVQPLAGIAISGICNNGVITCDAGTWQNCQSYAWSDVGGGVPGLQSTLTTLAGCYCINASCGSNLPFLNGSQILRDLSMGAIASVMNSQKEGVQVTETKPDFGNLQISMNGALVSECSGTVTGSSPTVTTGDSSVNSLLGLGESMTGENYTNDYLQDAGANSLVSMDGQPDSQGEDISADGFADPATRAQWNQNYQTNGNNYYKMVKNTDDITSAGRQELSCTIKRNFSIITKDIEVTGNGIGQICNHQTPEAKLIKDAITGNFTLQFRGTGPKMPICNTLPFPYSGNCWIEYLPTPTPADPNATTSTQVCSEAPIKPYFLWYSGIADNWVDAKTITLPALATAGTINASSGTGTSTNTSTTITATSGYILDSISIDLAMTGEGCNSGSGHISSIDTVTPLAYCPQFGVLVPEISYIYDIKLVEDVLNEGISDGCQVLENDQDCKLKDETIDGIKNRTNYMLTGLNTLPGCVTQPISPKGGASSCIGGTVSGSSCTMCRPWWEKKRNYLCNKPVTTNQDVQDIVSRGKSVSKTTVYDATTGDVTFNDTSKDKSGSWITTPGATIIKADVITPGDCDMVCKSSKIATDTQDRTSYGAVVDTTNPNKPQRTGVNTVPKQTGTTTATSSVSNQPTAHKEYLYKFCSPVDFHIITSNATDWKCPLEPDETQETACGCPDNFGEAVGKVNTLVEGAKNRICTSNVAK
jgi:hypothetical protein